MAPEELHILQHSLGCDPFGRGTRYRNYFATGAGSIDHPHCLALTEAGLMTRHVAPKHFGGMDIFYVTEAGERAMEEHSPPPLKLTAAQRRYAAWLAISDVINISFGDWLKLKTREARQAKELAF
jgi:hypothetical protein